MLYILTKFDYNSVFRITRIFNEKNIKSCMLLSKQFSTKIELQEKITHHDLEWANAKPFNKIPGPTRLGFLMSYLPGGKLHGKSLLELHDMLYNEYGEIVLVKGSLGQEDTIFTYNDKDFEKVYRTEGIWPIRRGIETFEYYRKVLRPDVFKNLGGLVTDQGESWGYMRSKVNPILMKPQTVKHHLPEIDIIASEFIKRISKIRDPETKLINNFSEEINKWAFESIGSIALNKRFGLIESNEFDPTVQKLANAMKVFFQLAYELDVEPSIWKFYKTKKFKKLISTYDDVTEITTNYIEDSIRKFEQNNNNNNNNSNENNIGVVDQLLKVDRQVAIVMAIDMLMAGIDTTSSAFISFLYRLAKNPDKQEKLREEIIKIMPEKDTKLTKENTKNMPYLRACIKESLRMISITPANFRVTGQDLVLSGYQIPKGSNVLMGVLKLSNDDRYFANSGEYLPERWLKDEKSGCPHLKSTNPFVYLPFGFGSRTCIGKRIAEMEIETLTTKIIRNYRVKWIGDDLKYSSNLIISPVGELRFVFEDI